ncbi:hypothetical protein K280104A7_27260 [Candidatus Bariatricus faecipullorum]
MPREVGAVIIHLESRAVCRLQYQTMSQSKKVYVEMVRQIVESELNNDEDAE